jgi:Fe-Mn family superoxide dismutase
MERSKPTQAYVPPGRHRLPPLPYPYNALEPVISERTLRIHHDRHHLSYVEGLNNAELKLVEARRMGDFSLVKHWEREIAFNGSGHILHSIYWTVMAPPATREPGYYTRMEIEKYFGSFTSFKEQFTEASIQVEASGWGVLCWVPSWGRLEILMIGCLALFVLLSFNYSVSHGARHTRAPLSLSVTHWLSKHAGELKNRPCTITRTVWS